VKGRTDRAQIPSHLLTALEPIVERFVADTSIPDSTILYGEGYGAKIQKGGHYIPDGNDFCLFDVNIQGNWQERMNVFDIGDALGLKVAPVLATATLSEWVDWIKQGDYAESELHSGARNEGVVLRPPIELMNRRGQRIITKLKFKDFKR
jgi:hypothetical protein